MMTKFYLTFLVLLTSLFALAQRDSVSTLDTNDVFYSLTDGTEQFVDRNSWDIAFSAVPRSVSILINEGKGLELYLASSNINDWAGFDTTGMSWTNLYNSVDDWEEGAFNTNGAIHPDYGWGLYNAITHDINASRFFILKLADGTHKKVKIDKMTAAGVYSFTYENLDGTGTVSKTIDKSTITGKDFVYFNISSGTIIDDEPIKSTWDLLFTKYLSPSLSYYPVSGIKVRKGLLVAQRDGVETSSNDTTNLNWSTSITEIGDDWKSFNRTTFQYEIQDSLSFFVKKPSGEVWKVVFTGYEGSGQGKFIFEKSLIEEGSGTVSTAENNKVSLEFYPNPSKGKLFFSEEIERLTVFNLSGQKVYESMEITNELNLDTLPSGSYFIRYEAKSQREQRILILE